MARVTVEDCVTRVSNRFQLVMLAAQRARNIGAGGQLTVERDDDKNPVIALREIADGTVSLTELESNLIQSLQKVVEQEQPLEEEMDLLAIQREQEGEVLQPDDREEMVEDDLSLLSEDEDEEESEADEGVTAPPFDVDFGDRRFSDTDTEDK